WIEAEMRALLAAPTPAVQRHYAIMQYHMGWLGADLRPARASGGKRVRPLLCLLACAAVGGDPQSAVPAAAGLELLHNFSLIHDDIEDGSPTRRHRPTAWSLFGMPQACNAGDGMFSLAHAAFYRLMARGVPGTTVLAALEKFDAMCVRLTEGQYLDMSFESRLDVSVEEYFAMIASKTGALLAIAPELGALLGGAVPEVVAAYRRFGAALGRAFQLRDDILGIWGDEEVTGKSAASDILSKKKTLPVIYALSHPQVGPRLRALYAGPAFSSDDVAAVLVLLEEAGAREYTQAQVHAASSEARRALDEAAATAVAAAHAALGELLDALIERQE
ncbi:MAG: polyprenyl synthetase family protein, partial [Anaerolineae bacterium]